MDPIAGASAAAARSWSAASGLLRVVQGDTPELPGQACRRCGCTEQNACVVRADGELRACSWSVVDPSICDACLFPSSRVRGPLDPLEQLASGGVQ